MFGKLLCLLGFHKWHQWKDFAYNTTHEGNDTHRQCVRCHKQQTMYFDRSEDEVFWMND